MVAVKDGDSIQPNRTRAIDTTPDAGAAAAPDLLPVVYAQLHALARQLMSGERANHTLQPTALVHEAYARLARDLESHWQGPREFYVASAQAMRRILIEHARKRSAAKRGGQWLRESFDEINLASDEDCGHLLALDEAILRLEKEDGRAAEVVRLRFYAGLTVDQTAVAMDQSRRTVLRDWEYARAWLLDELQKQQGQDEA